MQYPRDAAAPDMPLNALGQVAADYCLPLAETALLIECLAAAPTLTAGQDRTATWEPFEQNPFPPS